MIRRSDQLSPTLREAPFGGKGSMDSLYLLQDAEFYGKGRMFARNTLKPGCSLGKHKHQGEFEAYYILQGEGMYHDNGKDVPVKAGDAAYAWDGESHALENTGKEDLIFIALVLFTK